MLTKLALVASSLITFSTFGATEKSMVNYVPEPTSLMTGLVLFGLLLVHRKFHRKS